MFQGIVSNAEIHFDNLKLVLSPETLSASKEYWSTFHYRSCFDRSFNVYIRKNMFSFFFKRQEKLVSCAIFLIVIVSLFYLIDVFDLRL